MTRALSRRARCAAFAAALGLTLTLGAGPGRAVSFDVVEPQIDAIFGQPSFDASPIDIRFRPLIELHGLPGFAVFDTATDGLFAYDRLRTSPDNVAAMFFIDDFVSSGGFSPIVGLALVSGRDGSPSANLSAIDSGYIAANPEHSAWLIAHELSHNLGLGHGGCGASGGADCGAADLMSPVLGPRPGTLIWESQVATILRQPLVRASPAGLFVEIQPYRVTAFAVPSPVPVSGSGAFMLGALLAVAALGRRSGIARAA